MSFVDLPPREVHLWTTFHGESLSRFAEFESLLTPDELGVRDRLDADRAVRFTTTRATLRSLIARYTGIAPLDVRFRYGPRGKPFLLENSGGEARVQFNLSDSGDVVVFGFSSDREIGVDIERVRAVKRWEAISRRFFGEAEAAELCRMTDERERDRRFIARWVLEEARIKATGQGIWARNSMAARGLVYHSFVPAPDYFGGVAAPGSDWLVKRFGGDAYDPIRAS